MVIRWLRSLVVPLALAGMLAVAGLGLSRIYSGALAAQLFVGAAVGSVAISVAVRRLPSWVVGPLSVLGLAGFLVLAVRLAAAAGQVPGPLPRLAADALRNGIPRVLTAMIPIEPQPDTVLVPVVAVWLGGLAGAELALRARRVLLACLPPTLLYAVVLYAVGPNADATPWPPLCFATLAAVALAASARSRGDTTPELTTAQRTALRVRVAAGAAVGLVVTVGLAAAIGPAVASGVDHRPTDPRRYVAPPQLDPLDENPLVRLSGWALNPDQHLFDVRLSGGSGTPAIRLAVLNDYDGVTWRVGATYRNAGRVLTGPHPTSGGSQLTQQITIADLDGKLVPAAAVPERVDGTRIAFDQASGTIAMPDGLRAGLTYTVVSKEPKQDVNLLPTADLPKGPDVARFVALGSGAPDQIRRLATQLADGNGAPFARAQAIEQFLSEHYALVADAPSGHAYPNLSFFLFGPRGGGGQKGTSEQFAASFAVLARLTGLPTRIVVGFRPKPGATTVRGADALAWPEVLFDKVGWVAFDPLPQPNTQPRPVEDDFKPKPDPSTPPPSIAPTTAAPSATPVPSRTSAAAARSAGTPTGLVAAAVTTGVFLVVVSCLVAIVLLRRGQRRRRLYTGDPPGRIIGAWLEVLDALRLAGRPAPGHLAATEVAEHAALAAERQAHGDNGQAHSDLGQHSDDRQAHSDLGQHSGVGQHSGDRQAHSGRPIRPAAPGLDDLAGLVNVVAFAPDGASAAQADQAVAQAVAYADDLRNRRSWWRRLLWSADPRPLRWSRRR